MTQIDEPSLDKRIEKIVYEYYMSDESNDYPSRIKTQACVLAIKALIAEEVQASNRKVFNN